MTVKLNTTLRGLAAALLLLGFALGAAAQQQVRIAAVVNDEVITLPELLERLDFVVATSGLPDDDRTRQQLGPQVLRTYIDETLQLQEARRLGIRVDRSEVEAAIADLARRNGMTPQQFRAWFRERGLSLDTLRRQIRAQLAWARVIARVLKPRVVVSREQVELALDGRDAGGEELRLAEILLPVYSPEQEQQVLEQAAEVVRALRDGADFAALARQISVAASADSGGDLGWVPVEALAESVRRLVVALPPGQPSDPVVTPDGVRILVVRDRRRRQDAGEEVFELGQLVVPLPPDAGPEDVAAAERQARAVRPRLTSCSAAEALAREMRTPGSGRLGWMKLDQLPPDFRAAVVRLGEGEATEPLRGPLGVHLLVVCKRGGEEGRRALARLALEREQLERLASRYLRELRESAYIDIRL